MTIYSQIYPREARVLRCSISGGWYRKHIGKLILIERGDHQGFWAREGGQYNAINIVRREDVFLTPLPN
jgi:hypothetical protein